MLVVLQAIDRAMDRGEITADAELTDCDDVASDGDLLVNFHFSVNFAPSQGVSGNWGNGSCGAVLACVDRCSVVGDFSCCVRQN